MANMKIRDVADKRRLRNDMIFIVLILFVAIIGMLYLFVLRSGGNTVKVTVDGKVYGTYKLTQNIIEDIITGENGEKLNRLVVKDGKAYMETATCPDGICVEHRPIFRDGESIVCLPQRVVITVITDKSDSPDVIV